MKTLFGDVEMPAAHQQAEIPQQPAQNLPAMQRNVSDLIDEYDEKVANIDAAIQAYKDAIDTIKMASVVQGTYAEQVVTHSAPHREAILKNLNISGWKAVANRIDFKHRATAQDKQLFERTLASPPPLSYDAAVATFGDYLVRPRFHTLRGLAEVFTSLDPAYRSHSKVKIGVKGLPKRVILTGFDSFSVTYAVNQLTDILNALAIYQEIPLFSWAEYNDIEKILKRNGQIFLDGSTYALPSNRRGQEDCIFESVDRGLTLKKYGNGNIHAIFTPSTLRDINVALAEFYGDVLPDVTEDDPAPSQSTALAKDLQFYWTPEQVAKKAASYCEIWTQEQYSSFTPMPPLRVLEPSCGDGCLMDVIDKAHEILGFECHGERAAQARAKGYAVVTANFLEQIPTADFDRVLMNPPFYGRHYAKHVRHAFKFLKPGGYLVAILPATACYDHVDLADMDGEWRDLPTASFAAAGTNVPTVMLRLQKKYT